jgi:hypothetical protein
MKFVHKGIEKHIIYGAWHYSRFQASTGSLGKNLKKKKNSNYTSIKLEREKKKAGGSRLGIVRMVRMRERERNYLRNNTKENFLELRESSICKVKG